MMMLTLSFKESKPAQPASQPPPAVHQRGHHHQHHRRCVDQHHHHPHHLVIDVVAILILGLIVRMLELDRDCGLVVPVTPYVRPKTARRFPIYGSFYLDKTGQRPFDANIYEHQNILTQDVKG